MIFAFCLDTSEDRYFRTSLNKLLLEWFIQ